MDLMLISLAALTAFAAEPGPSAIPPAVIVSTAAAPQPPQPPAHAQRLLQSAADVSRDLADTVAYLEAGLVYFRAFSRDTHTREENQKLLEFLRDYEEQYNMAKKEEAVLRDWLAKAASLKQP